MMARVHFDPIVQGISRNLGGFNYAVRNGKGYIRMRPAKPRRETEGQVKQKIVFSEVARCWSILPEQMKKAWGVRRSGSSLTEYNLFFSENLPRHRKSEILLLCPGTGTVAPADISVSSPAQGELTVTCTPGTKPLYQSIFVQHKTEDAKTVFSAECEDSTLSENTFKGFTSGETVTVYCIFSDKPLAEKGKISASRGISVTIK